MMLEKSGATRQKKLFSIALEVCTSVWSLAQALKNSTEVKKLQKVVKGPLNIQAEEICFEI